MKLTTLLLLGFLMQVGAAGNAQTVTLHKNNISLVQVFDEFHKQTGYNFLYTYEQLEKAGKVSVRLKGASLRDALSLCLKDKGLTYSILENTVIIKKAAEIPEIKVEEKPKVENALIEIRGKVTNEDGSPLAGVSVILKESKSVGTTTNENGEYSLALDDGNGVLVFSAVGHVTREIPINGRSTVNVTLQTSTSSLDDVVVIGYGTTTRKKLIGAVDQISSKYIENRPVGNLTQALQGAAPSLLIQQKSMDPNNNTTNINIRGINTFTNANPLVVIDGMISDIGNMNKLNPNDVDNISVLKDAGTAAIYGSRSANGVILITTKQGIRNSKPTVQLGASYGVQTPDILYRPVEGWQNATLLNIALANGDNNPAYTPEQIQDLKDHEDAEWMMDYIFKNAPQQSYDVNVSGGAANSTYMVSGGYFSQGSNFIGPGYGIQRYNLRTKFTTEYKRLKINVVMGYVRNDIRGDEANQGFKIADASRTPKYYFNVPKTEDGRYINSSVGTNVAAQLDMAGYNKHNNDWINVGTSLDFSITNDLKLKGVFGYDLTSDWRFIRRFQYPIYNSIESTEPVMNGTDRETENYAMKGVFINAQVLMDYNKQIGKHTVSAMGGVSQEVLNNRGMDAKTRFTDPDLGTPISGETFFDDSRTEVNNTLKRVIQSGFGRVNYSYDDRYSVEFTIRADGSSRFPKENRWGTFPSVSLGWTLSEETFMSNYKENVGNLKLRGSWGILGNQEIADYQYFTTYTVYSNIVGFDNTIASGTGFQIGSPDLRWEKVNAKNIGADLSFLRNSLTASVDVFFNKTTDILLSPITPSVLGTTLGDVNIGSMQNSGWEVNVGYNLRTGTVNHIFSFNLGNTQNKAVELGNPEIRTVDNIGFIRRNGLPLGAYYGLKTDGLFQSYDKIAGSAVPVGANPQPGDVKYVDRNNDGIIDDADRFYLGDGFPHYNFGFTYNVNYNGFDLSLLIQGVGKRLQSLRGDIYTPFHNGAWYPVIFTHELDTWTVTNTDAKYPRLTTDNSASFANNWEHASDLFLLDAKYLRLKNIQLGYTLPDRLVSRLGLGKVRAYVNAQNPFTFSENSFIDPESTEFDNMLKAGGGNSGRNYPTLKFYGGGINIEF